MFRERIPKEISNCLLVCILVTISNIVESAPSNGQRSTCLGEMIQTNRTLSIWADNLEDMVNESTLPNNIRSTLHEEADRLLDMIGDFGDNLTKKPVEQLSKDLVNIRRRSNRLALDIYLNTFDMRWPQASLQLGVLVERAQQACSLSADRAATLVFNRILQQSIN